MLRSRSAGGDGKDDEGQERERGWRTTYVHGGIRERDDESNCVYPLHHGSFRAAGADASDCIFLLMTAPLPSARQLLLLLALLGACRDGESAGLQLPPPPAEFVLSAGDSSFWVSSAAGKVQLRGAPLELAVADGRIYELYVADDDRSYSDAVLVGQKVFRRDLATGDSLLLYRDTVVSHLARVYRRLHPEDRPLRPDDEPNEEPLWTATSTLALEEIAGPFVSYSLHTDVAPLAHQPPCRARHPHRPAGDPRRRDRQGAGGRGAGADARAALDARLRADLPR